MKKEITITYWTYILMITALVLNMFVGGVNLFKEDEPKVRVFYNGVEVIEGNDDK